MKTRGWSWFALLLLAALGAVAYANTFDGGWVWDDASSVLLHRHVQDPSQFWQLFREDQHKFGRGQGNFYRPLVAASFMLDYFLSYDSAADGMASGGYPDVKPFLFHVSNIFWHVLAAFALFLVLGVLGAPNPVRLATCALFVVHPLHTEAVAYISGRADMMSAAFIFLALWFALGAVFGGDSEKHGAPLADLFYGALALFGSTACFVLGLLSKESSLIFPALLALALLLRARKEGDIALPRVFSMLAVVPSLLVLGGYLYLRSTVLRFADMEAGVAAPMGQRIVEAGQAFAFYLHRLFLPFDLHMEQTLAQTPAWTAVFGYAGLAVLVSAGIFSWRRGHGRIALGLAWFIAAWLPISGLFPLNAPMAEHWMYVPMAGFWWAVCEGAALLASRPLPRRIAVAGAFLLLLFFTVLTVRRNADWDNNERLFLATLKQNPASLRVQYNLAVAYEDLLGNDAGARRHWEKVLTLQAMRRGSGKGVGLEEAEAHLSIGNALLQAEEYAAALPHFAVPMQLARVESFRREAAAAAYGMGRCYLALGDYARAAGVLQEGANLDRAMEPVVKSLLEGAALEAR